jgi:hypothetical protein
MAPLSFHETATSQLMSKNSQQIQELVRSLDKICLIDEKQQQQRAEYWSYIGLTDCHSRNIA